MPTFVSLIHWTEQGAKNAKQTVERARQTEQLAEQLGGKVTTIFWTLGAYDVVLVAEAPDDETMTAIAVALGALGNVRTETLRAFSADEFQRILEKVS